MDLIVFCFENTSRRSGRRNANMTRGRWAADLDIRVLGSTRRRTQDTGLGTPKQEPQAPSPAASIFCSERFKRIRVKLTAMQHECGQPAVRDEPRPACAVHYAT